MFASVTMQVLLVGCAKDKSWHSTQNTISRWQQNCVLNVATSVGLGCCWAVTDVWTPKVSHESLCSGGKAANISSAS